MKQAMIITLVIIYSIVMLLVLFVFMNNALKVQNEITQVAQDALSQEIDVLKFGNQSATDIQDVQATLVQLQADLINVFN